MSRRIAALIACLFIISGCGGGGGSSNNSGTSAQAVPVTGGGSTPAAPANVLINFRLSARAVPAYIQQFRCTGLSGTGAAVYGPKTFDRVTQVRLDSVPLEVTTLRIEYIQGGAVRGLANISVTLRAGQTLEIDDPDFRDVAAVLEGLLVEYPRGQVPLGATEEVVVLAIYNTGERQEVTASVEWSISDPNVVEIDGEGALFAKTIGRTSIAASFGSVRFEFEIEVGDAVLRSLDPSPESLNLPVGLSEAITVDGLYSDGSRRTLGTTLLSFEVENENLVQVDAQGVLTALSPGFTTLLVGETGGLRVSVPIEVVDAVAQGLRIETPTTVFPKGVSDRLRCFASYSDGSDVEVTSRVVWSSEDTEVATISNIADPGLLYARSLGYSSIKAEFGDLEASVSVEVSAAEPVELVVAAEITITEGLNSQLSVVANYTDGTSRTVTHEAHFSSLAPAIARVNTTTSRGLVTGVAPGETEVYVEFSGLLASVRAVVLEPVVESVRISPEVSFLRPGATRVYRAFARYNNNTELEITDQVAWSANSAFVSQAGAGEFTASPSTNQEATVDLSVSFGGKAATASVYLRRFIFVATNGVRIFSIDLATDYFRDGTAVSGTGPLQGIAIHPTGAFLFGVDSSTGSVRAFRVKPDRSLEAIGSPLDIGTGTGPMASYPAGAIKMHPSGEFLYVCNRNTNELWVLSIDDGEVAVLQGPISVAAGPNQFSFDRDSQYLYLNSVEAEVVSSYRVSANGTLSPVEVLDLSGAEPKSVAVDPEWNNLYVALSGSNEVVMYRIQNDGRVARVSGSVALSNSPEVVAAQDGRLYVGSDERGDGRSGTYALKEAALPLLEQTRGFDGAIVALAVDRINLDLFAVEYRPFGFADFIDRLELETDGTIGSLYFGRTAGTTIGSIALSP